VKFVLLLALVGPFSHELHLKLPAKFTCVSCHASVSSSTKLEDNNLPAVAVCLGCHKEVNIQPKPPGLLARFNHQKHLSLGNIAPVIRGAIDSKTYLSPPGDIRKHLDSANACAACHRGMEQSTAPARHDFPQMADCLVCHSTIDPPFSCTFCHEKGAALKPANHTSDFIDAHHRKDMTLDKASCAVCHGRKFTCLGCH
jgi:decaheme cytochrome c component MtrC/MtrF-like protein